MVWSRVHRDDGERDYGFGEFVELNDTVHVVRLDCETEKRLSRLCDELHMDERECIAFICERYLRINKNIREDVEVQLYCKLVNPAILHRSPNKSYDLKWEIFEKEKPKDRSKKKKQTKKPKTKKVDGA